MTTPLEMLEVAVEEARIGLAEGGIPFGAALLSTDGTTRTFTGGHDWLADNGLDVAIVDDERCVTMMRDFIAANADRWAEDIGE